MKYRIIDEKNTDMTIDVTDFEQMVYLKKDGLSFMGGQYLSGFCSGVCVSALISFMTFLSIYHIK